MVKNPPVMQETWILSLSQEAPLEKGMATHPSIFAWEISTEEPDGLQATGSQRVGHDWVTKHSTCLFRAVSQSYLGCCLPGRQSSFCPQKT